MKLIPLTKGFSAQVDDDLYEYLSRWKWHYNNGHAERKEYRGGKQRHVLMHRVILRVRSGRLVDHKNGDPLDNRRANLRLANHSTNAMNMRKHRGQSRYKGVSKNRNSWRVQICKGNEKPFRVSAPTERWAAMIYDLNAPALFGEFARPNFPNALTKL